MNLMEAVYFKRLDTGRRFNDKLAIIILEKVGKGKKKLNSDRFGNIPHICSKVIK